MANTENVDTERLPEACINKTMPIYWGNKYIGKKLIQKHLSIAMNMTISMLFWIE
jgi:hypothetical protein